jgi:hypothetical protein
MLKFNRMELQNPTERRLPAQYLDNVVTDDVAQVHDKARDEAKLCFLFRPLVRNKSTTAAKLLSINHKFERPATTLCVICDLTNVAYRRPDGVCVVPITVLKP